MVVRFKALGPLLLVLACLFTAGARPTLAADGDKIPPGWEEVLRLDRERNIPRREHEILSPDERKIFKIYVFELPTNLPGVQVQTSSIPGDTTKDRFLVSRRGYPRDTVRILVADRPGVPYEEFLRQGFRPAGELRGVWMQSRATYFVWDPRNPSAPPYYVKMSRKVRDRQTRQMELHNGLANALGSVLNSDIVEHRLRDSRDPLTYILPERFAAGIRIGDFEYGMSIRLAEPPQGPPQPGLKPLPLHGLLGSPEILQRYASAHGYGSANEWVEKEYIPKLAQFLANNQFDRGLFFESHTQNLKLYVSPESGEILGFAGIDMNDVMFDHFAPIAHGQSPHAGGQLGMGGSRLNEESIFRAHPEAAQAGQFFRLVTAQAIEGATRTPADLSRLGSLFLKAYLHQAEERLHHPVPLSRKSRAALDALASGKPPAHPKALLATVVQDIQDGITQSQIPELTPAMKAFPESVLTRLFHERRLSDEVIYFCTSCEENIDLGLRAETLGYAHDGHGVFAYDRESGKVLAYAFNVPDQGYRPATSAPALSAQGNDPSGCGGWLARLARFVLPSTQR